MNLYLIKYGADNELWETTADSREDAIDAFCIETDSSADDVNHVYLLTEV